MVLYKHNGIDMPVYMAGFTAQDYHLQKWTNALIEHGYTVPVWYENGKIGSKKTRTGNTSC